MVEVLLFIGILMAIAGVALWLLGFDHDLTNKKPFEY